MGILGSAFVLKTDPGVRQVGTDDVGDPAQADGRAAGVIDAMDRLVGQHHARKNRTYVIYMDCAAHRVLEGKAIALPRAASVMHRT